ncbi:hypothetical protein ART_2260 [Arthrobacter sp. PAMC 25486]|uniref:hypothetical protein n=1 Tax=Arthrobacter sp. PAMC 25486 TaxID=1494608 RepID=UPI000536306B|nr:hypothetical protein [Arthrobacter sp. PAMC 25486]AIY01859.1 hypothetical protein ART_2260 [Arthrobacter sp. PAMC 25486]
MRTPKPLPWPLAQQAFTLDQAERAGLSRSRTRAPDLWTPSRSIRIPHQGLGDWRSICRANLSLIPDGIASHNTAASLHGLFLPSRLENHPLLQISRPMGQGRPQRNLLRGHELFLEDGDVVELAGMLVTSVQRTLLDIAPLLAVDEIVEIADQIVCAHAYSFKPPKFPMVSLGALHNYIERHTGMRGIRKVRAAMELVRVGSDSPRETQLRLLIERTPLPAFECNVEIKDPSGTGRVGPDLACKKYRTCAEYDGAHHFTAEQQGKDHDRDFVTKSLDWHQALINNHDMKNGGQVAITKIARMLVQGGWPDPHNLAGQSLRGKLSTRRDFE